MQPIGTHSSEVMYFGCVCFRSELGFLNCDDICMCVVNSSLGSSSLFLIPFMLTCSMMMFLSLFQLGLGHCGVSVVMWSLRLSLRLSWYAMWMLWLLCVLLFVSAERV